MFPNKGLYQREHVPKREQKNKFIPIDQRQSKQLLIKEEGHYEVNSVIGKRTDKKAIASLMKLKKRPGQIKFLPTDYSSFAYSQKNP